jgi:hypothetical protein
MTTGVITKQRQTGNPQVGAPGLKQTYFYSERNVHGTHPRLVCLGNRGSTVADKAWIGFAQATVQMIHLCARALPGAGGQEEGGTAAGRVLDTRTYHGEQ